MSQPVNTIAAASSVDPVLRVANQLADALFVRRDGIGAGGGWGFVFALSEADIGVGGRVRVWEVR